MRDGFEAFFMAGQEYAVDRVPDGTRIRDAQSRVVALLPTTPGGDVRSGNGSWMIGVERQRGWLVVAREPVSQEPVGCAYPRSLRNAFDVWVAPDRSYRLRAKAFTGAWILRGQDGALARFTPGKDRIISVAETIVCCQSAPRK